MQDKHNAFAIALETLYLEGNHNTIEADWRLTVTLAEQGASDFARTLSIKEGLDAAQVTSIYNLIYG